MFQVLKQVLSSKTAPKAHPYYGSFLTVKSKSIDFFQHKNDQSEIKKSDIDYISIYKFEDSNNLERCWINLKSYSEQTISINTLSGNFDYLEKWLFTLPDFDKKKYQEIRKTNADFKEFVLWTKKSVAKFEIEANTNKNQELKEGIFIENLNFLLPWQTYNELENNKILIRKKVDYPNPSYSGYSYTIVKPTIFGGLKLSNLYSECDSFTDKPKLDLPVIKYMSEIKLGYFDTQNNYLKIKKHLDTYFQKEAESRYGAIFDSNVNDSLYAIWVQDKICVTFYCFYRDQYKKHDTNAWLTIDFLPNTTRFFESDYQKNLQIHKYLEYEILPFEVDIHVDYRQIDNVIFTPKCFDNLFENENQFIIWNDTQEGISGFGNAKHSRLFKPKDFTSMSLGLEDYGESNGSNALSVGDFYLGSMLSSQTHLFEKNIKKMEELINKKCYTFQEDPNRWR